MEPNVIRSSRELELGQTGPPLVDPVPAWSIPLRTTTGYLVPETASAKAMGCNHEKPEL